MRKLVIFGNGLGRALNNDFYDLRTALQDAWNDPAILTDADKRLIRHCFPEEVIEQPIEVAPIGEDQLDVLQQVLAACDEIAKYDRRGDVSWLSDHGRRFPTAIRSFLHRTASYFHHGPYFLDREFVNSLVEFVTLSRSHIATLNYDDLLYRAFIGTPAFNGYDCLLDGFVGNFAQQNLDRRRADRQAYYLHLHGSPLYYTTELGETVKARLGALPQIQGHASTHIVLTNVKHKMSVIRASEVLSSYWDRLDEAIKDCQSIMLFGYSGNDSHLNEAIERGAAGRQLEVVERKHPEYDTNEGRTLRFQFWKEKLGIPPVIFWYDNIVAHRNWTWQQI